MIEIVDGEEPLGSVQHRPGSTGSSVSITRLAASPVDMRPGMAGSGCRFTSSPAALSCVLVLLSLILTAGVSAGVPPAVESQRLVALALAHNPRVLAARQELVRLQAERDGVGGFYDADFVAAAGRSEWARLVPGATRATGLPDNAIAASVGIEKPVWPGAYVSFGLAERRLLEPGGDYEFLYQSVLGARVWVPLARDRGFAVWRAHDRRAVEAVNAFSQRLVAVMQEVQHEVEVAYIEYLKAGAEVDTARMAVARAEKLLMEAQELVRLDVVAEYQLFPARMESALQQEDLVASRQALRTAGILLAELIGEAGPPPAVVTAEELGEWAGGGGVQEALSVEEACRRRGDYRAVLARISEAKAALALAREDMRSDIALTVSAYWQGEDPDAVIGTESLMGEEEFGSEMALVWRRPLGFRKERARARASEAAVAVLQEELRGVCLRIAAELSTARSAFAAAQTRLGLAAVAVDEASRTLVAEEARFRLGEGRSRNVLEAQKDLTTAVRRRNAAAAALLRARSAWLYATGNGTLEEGRTGEEPGHDR